MAKYLFNKQKKSFTKPYFSYFLPSISVFILVCGEVEPLQASGQVVQKLQPGHNPVIIHDIDIHLRWSTIVRATKFNR